MRVTEFLAAGLLATSATAHSDILSRSEISRRSGMSKRCEGHVAAFNKKRQAAQMAKRDWDINRNSTVEITSAAPWFENIQNTTCVLTPTVTEGPYVWPQSQTLRQDMSEDQPGVPLWLDIGVLDMG